MQKRVLVRSIRFLESEWRNNWDITTMNRPSSTFPNELSVSAVGIMKNHFFWIHIFPSNDSTHNTYSVRHSVWIAQYTKKVCIYTVETQTCVCRSCNNTHSNLGGVECVVDDVNTVEECFRLRYRLSFMLIRTRFYVNCDALYVFTYMNDTALLLFCTHLLGVG